jgi:16S rRNA (cytidine1402-2'-O)-methyltransferase
MLYIIPTPLGNLQDITLRAVELLKNLHYVICEDTRSTKKLMQLLNIPYDTKQFYSLTSFTNAGQIDRYVDLIKNNDVGLVSDAGTPWLSDPGKSLIEVCHKYTLPFTVLPGANALIPVVVASGFDTSQFVYIGFLPKKKGKQTLMKEMIASERPYFFYESVHRISKALQELYNLGFRGKVSIGRELTKMHEQLLTDSIENVLAALKAGQIPEKGEFVVGVISQVW